MSLKTIVKDRISKFPGRVKLTPVSGQTNVYDMVRADQPLEEGTAINAALFNKKCDALTEDVTVYVSKNGNDSAADGTSAKPYLTIQAALDSVPKNLDGHKVYIHIGAGTYAGAVSIENFSSGRVIITGASGAVVKIQGMVTIRKSGVDIENIALTIENSYMYITECGWVFLVSSASLTCFGAAHGIYARYGSHACLGGVFTVNNSTSSAVRVGENSSIYLFEANGTGNAVGIYAQGGVAWVRLATFNATTEYSSAHGGRIYNGAQTSAPKY